MLTVLKFPLQITKCAMACVTSVQFSVHINGHESDPFEGGKGLRQGDPLSQLLFVLSTEYLLRLLKQASQQHDFRSHPDCKQLGLTHLMFPMILFLLAKLTLHHYST